MCAHALYIYNNGSFAIIFTKLLLKKKITFKNLSFNIYIYIFFCLWFSIIHESAIFISFFLLIAILPLSTLVSK